MADHGAQASADSRQPTADSHPEWYGEGLQFECTQCGNCCTGPPGVVYFTGHEGRAIAKELGLDEATFYRKYARRAGKHWSLKEHETKHGFDCIFLDRERIPGKAVCSIYKTRPSQCRTWPFWPENLRSKNAWDETKRVTPCPGMDTGKLVPIEAIRVLRDGTR